MPARDGSGPAGMGPLTGKRLGNCVNANNTVYGYGSGMGRGTGMGPGLKPRCYNGFGRGYGAFNRPMNTKYPTDKEILAAEKEFLKGRLEIINSQLDELADDSE